MNWKRFKKEIEKTGKVVFIDMRKAKRGYNDLRILRFFFCGNFKPLVEKYKAIGFYVVIEKNYTYRDYDLRIMLIDKSQKPHANDIFKLYNLRHITEGYIQAINKIKELVK